VTAIDTRPEQRALKLSIQVTLLIGVAGVLSGLITGSQAIIFDGIYSFVDVLITLLSLIVSQLLARGGSRRFQYGFFHLEPLVTAVGGAILSIACIYAGITAVWNLMSGGHLVAFGKAAVWATVVSFCGFGMYVYIGRKSRELNSALLALDARAWLVTAALSIALLVGFVFAALLARTPFAVWVPYVDPLMLLLIVVAVLPVPLTTVVRAMLEVLQVAPDDLDRSVKAAMDEITARHGFLDYSTHVARIGRTMFVEIHVLVEPCSRIDVDTSDDIRIQLSNRLRATGPELWLALDFTADRLWL
jgi:cation diffusion facilitator family transporter